MNDCCNIIENTQTDSSPLCVKCGTRGQSVKHRTVLHHVKGGQLSGVNNNDYRFCSTPSCSVVYFGDDGSTFTVGDLRELVTAKTSGEARPLCYCFGFTEGNILKDITLAGETNIPSLITGYIKKKICACEIRNPSGACCLREVNQTIKRLTIERQAITNVDVGRS